MTSPTATTGRNLPCGCVSDVTRVALRGSEIKSHLSESECDHFALADS